MQIQTQQWQEIADDKALFLRCYQMMTSNVLTAVNHHEFNDPIWVSTLLDRFADYYFVALRAYESDSASAPTVWQVAHNAAKDPAISAMQCADSSKEPYAAILHIWICVGGRCNPRPDRHR